MSLLGRLKEAVRPYYLRWLYFPIRPDRRPREFRECWRYPYQKIEGDAARLSPAFSQLPYLLFFPMTDWHARTQRTQHLVRALAALGFPCVYINPHLGREFETTPLFDRTHRISRLEQNIFELHIRLQREPVFHDRLLTPAEEETVLSAVRRVMPSETAAIQVLSFPLWAGIAGRLREESGFRVVYDCHDLLSGFEKMSAELIAAEADLLRDADLVLFSSEGLANRYRGQVQRSVLVRNAVDFDEFQSGEMPTTNEPDAAAYVGALDSWFDVEALRTAASRNPQCRFILAGHVEYSPIQSLRSIRNVELIGEIPYATVPRLLGEVRAGLIPFVVTPLTLMTNPIKLYEYFSVGLPVVTAPLPEAMSMGDLVYIAHTPDEFAEQVTHALQENDPERRLRRQEIAARENWAARAHEISAEFTILVQSR